MPFFQWIVIPDKPLQSEVIKPVDPIKPIDPTKPTCPAETIEPFTPEGWFKDPSSGLIYNEFWFGKWFINCEKPPYQGACTAHTHPGTGTYPGIDIGSGTGTDPGIDPDTGAPIDTGPRTAEIPVVKLVSTRLLAGRYRDDLAGATLVIPAESIDDEAGTFFGAVETTDREYQITGNFHYKDPLGSECAIAFMGLDLAHGYIVGAMAGSDREFLSLSGIVALSDIVGGLISVGGTTESPWVKVS